MSQSKPLGVARKRRDKSRPGKRGGSQEPSSQKLAEGIESSLLHLSRTEFQILPFGSSSKVTISEWFLKLSSKCYRIAAQYNKIEVASYLIEPLLMDLGTLLKLILRQPQWSEISDILSFSMFGSSVYPFWYLKHACQACDYLKLWSRI